MTTKEAVETIKIAIAEVEWEYPINYAAAFDMSIDALERENADGCKGCKYESKDEFEQPCLNCKHNKLDYWTNIEERNEH